MNISVWPSASEYSLPVGFVQSSFVFGRFRTAMLFRVLLVAVATAKTYAYYGTCSSGIAVSNSNNNISGALSTVADNDPTFVYYPENCTNTTQQVISTYWTIHACRPTIDAVCGQIKSSSAVSGAWIWSWFGASGATCQAGIFQPTDPAFNVAAPVQEECCKANFRAMLNAVASSEFVNGQVSPSTPNRVSVNIAPGKFPYTEVSVDGGQSSFTGEAVNAGFPSYILQG